MTSQPAGVIAETADVRATRLIARWPRATKWLFGPALALDVLLLLTTLSLAHITSAGPAQRALAQSTAILTEVDGLLDEHYESMHQEALETKETPITLSDYPLAVTFTPEEIRDMDRAQFRALLLRRSALLLHERGMAAFREERTGEIDSISPQGAVRSGLDALRPTPHRVFVVLTIVFAAIAGVLAFALALATRAYGRIAALGMSVLVAAVPFLVFAIALRFTLRVSADGTDDAFVRESLRLAQELTWAPIRDGIILSVGAALLLLTGVTLARWDGTHRI